MQLLHKISNFRAPIEDLKIIYFSYIRSIIEQSSNVWHSSINKEDEESLERIQKSALKIILKNQYNDYETACNIFGIKDSKSRRQEIFENFTSKNYKHDQLKDYFTVKNNCYSSALRNPEKFNVLKAKSERFKKSTIVQMQHTANKLHQEGKLK